MFKKILIPTDGSPLANQAAEEGIMLAKQVGAEVVAMFVARENQNPAFDSLNIAVTNVLVTEDYIKLVNDAGKELMQPLLALAEKEKVSLSKLIEISNDPAGKIVQTAESLDCDLIFMGSQGTAGWASRLLGSVAAKVVAASQIPVTVFKVKRAQLPPKAKINTGYLPV